MVDNFYALTDGLAPLPEYDRNTKETSYRDVKVHTLKVGDLYLPTGQLAASDPYVQFETPLIFDVPAGVYPVYVTVADVSPNQDGSHYREAYLTVKFSDNESDTVIFATPKGKEPVQEGDSTFYGVGVDAGMVGFYDFSVVDKVNSTLSDPDDLFDVFEEVLQEDGAATTGVFNLEEPETNGNVIFSHSGWGDGFYPVVQTIDKEGKLTGYHIDISVVGKFDDDEELIS